MALIAIQVMGVSYLLYAEEGRSVKSVELTKTISPAVDPASPAPAVAAVKLHDGIDLSQLETPAWRKAIEQLTKRPGVQSGQVSLSVMRVILKGEPTSPAPKPQAEQSADTVNGVRLFVLGRGPVMPPRANSREMAKGARIHATGCKLISLDPQDGGGLYKQLKSGDFVVMDHIATDKRKDGRDPLQIGSWTHRHAELWVPVPPRGELGVLGDLVLERVNPEEMGGIIVELDTSAVPGEAFKSMSVGPLFTGGAYGGAYKATEDGIAGTNRIAPGNYALAMPGISKEHGHIPVTVKPGETVYYRFRWNAERVLELVERQSLVARNSSQ